MLNRPEQDAQERMSRRQFLGRATAGGALLALPARMRPVRARGALRLDSVVVLWNEAALEGVRQSRIGPPMVARALAIVHTCAFDAWAAYDRDAVGTRLGDALRRPPGERTLANKRQAISVAAHRAAVDLFPGSKASVFDPLMAELGYDPSDASVDTSTPVGIANVAAHAVLSFRHRDGANQLGDAPGGTPGVPYSDYTGFVPTNEPMDVSDPFAPLDPTTVHDPNGWQPLHYVDGTGATVTPSFVGAHWQHVVPFALASSEELRSATGPARYGTGQYRSQAEQLVGLSAALTDEQKMIAEYWADGPRSELPPGHWDLHAQFVSRRDRHGPEEHGVDLDVKLFFALTNAIFDAGVCAWDNKCAFASVRPITALRYLYRGTTITAWAGPYRGTREIEGATWFPYQPTIFPTPPFPEYSSGHSCFSSAGAEILQLFTRSDRFGGSVAFRAGSSRVEPGTVPAQDLTFTWPTFADAADQAGMSRRYGGIHFEQGDVDARRAGRLAARSAWAKALTYFNGTA